MELLFTAAFLLLTCLVPRNVADFDECCQLTTIDDMCSDMCMEVLMEFNGDSLAVLTSVQYQALSSACSPTYSNFWSCMDRSTVDPTPRTEAVTSSQPSTPLQGCEKVSCDCKQLTATESVTSEPVDPLQPYYDCCSASGNQNCRQACSESLLDFNGDTDTLFVNLVDPCGAPPIDPVWQCLLSINHATPTPAPVTNYPVQPANPDWARVQCCYRAKDSRCKDSCLDLYSGEGSDISWSTFQLDCIHRPNENSLTTCLTDITKPCQLGCSGMQFCRNFNNRPFQFFRDCTISSDRLAKNLYYSWITNGRILHPLVTILVPNVDKCLSEAWKAVACFTYLQPCDSATHAAQICWSDCIRLLSQCTNSSATSKAICGIIAPQSSEERCTRLDQFLLPSPYGTDVISPIASLTDDPCDPNPCAEGFICTINRLCSNGELGCTPYECQAGCMVGTQSAIVLPKSGGMRVSLVSHSQLRYHGYVDCSSTSEVSAGGGTGGVSNTGSASSLLVNVQCEVEESCTLEDGSVYGHQSKFWVDCNFCTCFYGRFTCTNYTCVGNTVSMTDCGCENEYAPVCTRNGITLSNECQARCFGYNVGDYHSGDCGSIPACPSSGVTCGRDYRCIPQRKSCLLHNETQCPQYKCEPLDSTFCLQQSTPVCDITNNQHNTLCSFLRTQEEFNYFGYCKSRCDGSDTSVCGMNGETFFSECHAHNVYIYVDYYTSCQPTSNRKLNCSDVECPNRVLPGCTPVVPRGACCPLCGTVVTILTDKTILQRNIQFIGKQSLSSIDIMRRLQHYIRYTQCELYGHVEVDGSLTVIVVPEKNANFFVMRVCHQEALNLATIINNQTPRLASDPFLSHFVAAHVAASVVQEPAVMITKPTATPSNCQHSVSSVLLILLSMAIHCF